MWKWLLGIFLVLVVACGVGGYLFVSSPQFTEMKKKYSGGGKKIEVRLESAESGTLVRSVSAPGSVEAKRGVKISAQVSAKVIKIHYRPGEVVKENDEVVTLDSRDLQASLESAQASKKGEQARLEGAVAQRNRAKEELERQEKLEKTNDVSTAVVQAARAQFLQAESTVNSINSSIAIADANIRRAERDKENTVIKSPINGVVTALYVEEGEQVLGTFNNAGTVIMEIANLETMIVKARVDESTVNPVVKDQHARVYINMYPDAKFSGTVKLVGLKNLTDKDGTRYVEVEVQLDSTGDLQLRTGLTANVDIEVQTLASVLKVPSQAIIDRRVDDLPKTVLEGPGKDLIDKTRPFTRVVYVIEDGKAKAIPVTIGTSDLTHTIITAGLTAGVRVVAGPFKVLVDLKDGNEISEQTDKKNEGEKTVEGKKTSDVEKKG